MIFFYHITSYFTSQIGKIIFLSITSHKNEVLQKKKRSYLSYEQSKNTNGEMNSFKFFHNSKQLKNTYT